MRQTIIAAVLAFPAFACAGAAVEGRWEGQIEVPGRQTRVIVDLGPQSTGGWSGSIIVPGLGIKDAPLANVVATDSDVSFDTGKVLNAADYGPARFRLHLAAAGLAGEMSEGGNVAQVSLRRIGAGQVALAPRSTSIERVLEDQWSGEFELGGYPRQVTITLENHPGDGATATFVVVGKQVNNLPVDRVVQEGPLLRIESPTRQVTFEGRLLEATDELRGTIELGALERPLVLHRSPRRPS